MSKRLESWVFFVLVTSTLALVTYCMVSGNSEYGKCIHTAACTGYCSMAGHDPLVCESKGRLVRGGR